MQQLSKVCLKAEHDGRQIQYGCVFPQCNLSRFACNKCVRMGNHKHQQQDQFHVLDRKELYKVLQDKLSKRQKQQSMDYKHSDEQLSQLLLKLRNNGFNQFDDVQIKILLNIDEKVGDNKTQLLDQSNSIVQNATRIQDRYNSQKQDNALDQKIKDAKYKVITQDQLPGGQYIEGTAISNDFKFIVSGYQDQKLKIWNYSNYKLIKSIQLDDRIYYIKFTDDSRLLYVGIYSDLCQFDIKNNFKVTYKQSIHSKRIENIFCITNTIILTCSIDKTIIKTDVNLKQQLLLIKAHVDWICGLDYNHNLDMIASSSYDSIKIWNGNNGQLVLEKQNAHNKNSFINQVLFIIKGNQLISLDYDNTILVWKINYETKQLEQQYQISDNGCVFNISLVLNQQYITLVCSKFIKIYSIKGDYIKQFNHDVKDLILYNTIQPQSMKAIVILGINIIQICKVKIVLD